MSPELVLLLVPLVALQLGLIVLAIVDLLRDDRRVRGGNKGVWAIVIVFVSLFGAILYFLVGREEGPVEPAAPGLITSRSPDRAISDLWVWPKTITPAR